MELQRSKAVDPHEWNCWIHERWFSHITSAILVQKAVMQCSPSCIQLLVLMWLLHPHDYSKKPLSVICKLWSTGESFVHLLRHPIKDNQWKPPIHSRLYSYCIGSEPPLVMRGAADVEVLMTQWKQTWTITNPNCNSAVNLHLYTVPKERVSPHKAEWTRLKSSKQFSNSNTL